jgi:hypothetical protein
MNIMKKNRIVPYVYIGLLTWILIDWLRGPSLVVTYAEAEEVSAGCKTDGTGFSYDQVVDIVGVEGEFISTSLEASPISYRWMNPEGYGFMTANFIGGSLTTVQVHIDLLPR